MFPRSSLLPLCCCAALVAGIIASSAPGSKVLGAGDGLSPTARATAVLDANLWARIQRAPGLAVADHPRVAAAIARLQREPRYLERLAARAQPYLRLILAELGRRNLPLDLALLPEIESRYNPRAQSPASAAGLWQLTPITGAAVGLAQHADYDGRYDILAATGAALDHLAALNRTFAGDWALTLAAYNAGATRIHSARRANREAGRPTDYWSLDLPAETRDYVPKFLALRALVRQPEAYGLRLPAISDRPTLDIVVIDRPVSLAQAAAACEMSAATLHALNPGWRRETAPIEWPHAVLVPAEAGHKLRLWLMEPARDAAFALASADRDRAGVDEPEKGV